MILTPLALISDIAAGQSAPKSDEFSLEGTPFIRAGSLASLISGTDESKLELLQEDIAKRRKLKLYPKGSILFAKSGMSATKGRIYVLKKPAYVVSHLAILRPNESVYGEYLRLVLNYLPPSKLIKDPAYPAISLKEIASYKLPIPEDINDQKRIAHVLSKVEKLINERKRNILQFDDLLESIFIDMFGDPIRNEKGWNTDSLVNFGYFKNGLNYGKGESGIKVKYLGVGDFKSHSKISDLSSLSTIHLHSLPSSDYFLQDGDILFVRSNGNKELIGRCIAIFPQNEKVTFSGFCIRFRLEKKSLSPIYLSHLFREKSFHKNLLKGGQGANIQNINQKLLSSLNIPIPSVELQNKFASIVKKVESIKSQYQQSLLDLEELYGSLSQKAFKGDLDLSKVPLPEELEGMAESINHSVDKPVEEPFPHVKPLIMPSQTHSEYPLSDPTSRRQVLEYAFATFLSNIQIGEEISLTEFWQALLWQAGDYADETDLPFNANDYDLVKKQLYQAIADGKVEQMLNKVEMQNEVTDGNQIILKKLG
jgi:type I restriction enzyme S subunit